MKWTVAVVVACFVAVVSASHAMDEPQRDALAASPKQLSQNALTRLAAEVSRQIYACWTPPVGAKGANVIVAVQFTLNRDGDAAECSSRV
jgi:hypothetical protein